MTRAERITLAVACLAACHFMTYLLLPAVGAIGLRAVPLVPLAALGPTAFGVFLCVAVLKTGKPQAPGGPTERAGSYREAPSQTWDGDAVRETPRGPSVAWLVTVPLLIVVVLLALGGGMLFLGPFGPG